MFTFVCIKPFHKGSQWHLEFFSELVINDRHYIRIQYTEQVRAQAASERPIWELSWQSIFFVKHKVLSFLFITWLIEA